MLTGKEAQKVHDKGRNWTINVDLYYHDHEFMLTEGGLNQLKSNLKTLIFEIEMVY